MAIAPPVLPAPLTDERWHGLYRLGGMASLLIALLPAGEVIVYASFPRLESPLEDFGPFQDNWLAGLLIYDLLGMISYLLFVPTMLALYLALRRTGEAVMAIATALVFLGIADFFATNTVFPMLELSNRYAAATTEADRAMYLAAGQALGALFNENAYLLSYAIVSTSWLMVAAVMLRSTLFSRLTAWSGMLAGAAGIGAVVLEHIPGPHALLVLAIVVYFAAILFLVVWVLLAGRRLDRLGHRAHTAGCE